MPNYRRAKIAAGTFFFTVVTHNRRPIFADKDARSLLGECFRECFRRWPLTMDAVVLLPDHLHAIWSMPLGDADYSTRWSWIKKEFTKRYLRSGANDVDVSAARMKERRRGIWQPRFWEHAIRDDDDFERHFDYVHYNPVKHGYTRCPHEWPDSSFHRWVKIGVLSRDWACAENGTHTMRFDDIAHSVGE